MLIIGVPACFLSFYGCGAWGLCGVIIWFVVACFLFSVGYRSCLVPLIRFDETRREAGRRAAWLSWRGPSWLVDECI